MHKPLSLEEAGALYSLFQHPGMRVLRRRIEDSVPASLMPDLRNGGKEAHDRNVGRMIGVDGVLSLMDQLKEESIAKTKES